MTSEPAEAERVAALREALTRAPAPRGGLLRRLPGWAISTLRRSGTRAVRPWSARRIEPFGARAPLKLHLGSGRVRKEGWVNIDLVGARPDLAWDLVTGIPFETGSVDAVFHEHVLEHIELRDGLAFTRECLRVLRPGGVLRIGVPDAGALLRSYAGTGAPDWARSQPTPMLAVDALFYEHGHRAMYDEETLVLMLRAAGFAEVERSAFGAGRLRPSPDTPARRAGTLYVEGRKPPLSAG